MIRTPLILFLALAASAAQKHALVIGISHYLPGQGVSDLEGPRNDADAVAATLEHDFAFPRANIHVLHDAGRDAILAALDDLIAHVSPGDYVLIYYSGHGTSPQAGASRDLPIDADTGAIIPADFRRGTPAEVAARLIVGRRDLRPRLMKLDGKATVFGILDTCFSANLMKSIRPSGAPKGVPLGELTTGGPSMEDEIRQDVENTADASAAYPYRTVGWISAALAGQEAMDIDSAELSRDAHATFDGSPHGQLTNALLRGLRGQADLDNNGTVTHMELYEYLLRESLAWSHQPAWSANEGNLQFQAAPVLGGRTTPLQSPGRRGADGVIRVQLEGAASALRERVRTLPRVTLVDSGGDLVVRADGGGYRIYQSGGVPINQMTEDAEDTVGRIAAEPDVQRLVGWENSTSRLDMEMALFEHGKRTHKGYFMEGSDPFNLMLRSARPVWPLVVDVDVTGVVTVVYPNTQKGMNAAVAPGSFQDLGQDGADCPCGVNFLKAFAFETKPADYDSWADQHFPATDPRMGDLLKLAASGAAASTLRLLTVPGTAGSAPVRPEASPQLNQSARTYGQFMKEGQQLQNAGRWTEALAQYFEAAGMAPDLTLGGRAQYKVAQTLERLQDGDAALLWYRHALDLYRHADTEAAVKRLQGERFARIVSAAEITRGLSMPSAHSRGISVSIDLPVNFGYDMDTLTANGDRQVTELARALSDPAFADDRFVLVGHTDKHGSDQYNQTLSERRARRVRDALRDRFHFAAGRFDAVGKGKQQLLLLGDTEADDRLNRRVEVQRLAGAFTTHVTQAPRSEKYAVVVGVGQYPGVSRADGKPAGLEGARGDAERMAEALVRYGYPRDKMTVLLDSDATRDNILGALDRLKDRVMPGDSVVFYYSGHGTSSLDPKTGGFGMEPGTGAVVPFDIRGGPNILEQLIVGERDLRPRLSQLEQDADVVVIFDACFSGESVKSIAAPDRPAMRYLSLAELTKGGVSSDSIRAAERGLSARSPGDPYPYRKVTYLAAAANNEYAYDIGRLNLDALRGTFSTVDGLPHGSFTNALLRYLSAADPDVPQSCADLYKAVANELREQDRILGLRQAPQLLSPSSDSGSTGHSCFGPLSK